MQLFKVRTKRDGSKEIEFTHIETYRVLKEELAFKYKIEEKKKYFYRWTEEGKRVVKIQDLKDAFREYLKDNYDSLHNPESISLEDLLEASMKKTPIYVSNSSLRDELAREY